MSDNTTGVLHGQWLASHTVQPSQHSLQALGTVGTHTTTWPEVRFIEDNVFARKSSPELHDVCHALTIAYTSPSRPRSRCRPNGADNVMMFDSLWLLHCFRTIFKHLIRRSSIPYWRAQAAPRCQQLPAAPSSSAKQASAHAPHTEKPFRSRFQPPGRGQPTGRPASISACTAH